MNHRNLFTGNIWKTKRDNDVFSFKSDGTLTLLVLMYWLCRDLFILCDNFTFHANFCNSILLFPSPLYATRYLCFQGNIRQMWIFLLTAGDKCNPNDNRWISRFVLAIYRRYISETSHGLLNVEMINHQDIGTIFEISWWDIVLARLSCNDISQSKWYITTIYQCSEVRCNDVS